MLLFSFNAKIELVAFCRVPGYLVQYLSNFAEDQQIHLVGFCILFLIEKAIKIPSHKDKLLKTFIC